MSDEEGKDNEGGGRKYKAGRTLFIPIEDIDLKTADGQDELLRRIQVKLATENHNNLDLRALTTLKDTVKIKTDLSVLRMFQDLQRKFKEFESKNRA